jgi:hypothetical protein
MNRGLFPLPGTTCDGCHWLPRHCGFTHRGFLCTLSTRTVGWICTMCAHYPIPIPPYLVPPHPRRVILPSFFLFDSAFLDSRLLVPCECRSRALAFVALRVRPPECLDVHFFAASLVHSMIASHSREFCCYCSAAPSDLTPRAVPDALRVTGGRVVQRSRFRSWDRDSTASLPRW